MNPKKPNLDDLRDRLLDQALRETLGGETPPDLSQQIFTAASQPTEKLSTLATGDEAMNANHEKARKTRKFWMGLAVAASLLVAAGFMILPALQAPREAAIRTRSSSNFQDVKQLSDGKLQMMVEPQVIVESTIPVQDEIDRAKRELKEIEVGKMLALQQARSPMALEEAAAETLAVDPRIANFHDEKYALAQQLRWLQAQTRSGNAKHTKKLQQRYKQLEQEEQRYRQLAGAEIRGRLKNAPQMLVESASAPPQSGVTEFYNGGGGVGGGTVPQRPGLNASGKQSFSLGFERGASEPAFPYIKRKFRQTDGEGSGQATSGDQYTRIYENPFITAEGEKAVSTFSIDVDTASYANVRQFLMQSHRLPPPDAVRIEELVNYFQYDYTAPTADTPFAAHVEIAGCPWHPEHRLVRIGIKGREIELKNRPQSNLVFLIDVSGSMNEPAKLPLLIKGLKMLTRQLNENDRVAIVVYASSEGLALPSTRGDQQDTILAALEKLRAGGSTAGGAGIQLAYQIAEDHFIEGGTNRVILATDGDFNVGTTSTADLERLAKSKAKETGVFLTVLGFGRGNLNDAMMEAISGKGNGNYHYIDNQKEARKVLVEEMTGTLLTIAKDVKIQVEFNPAQVAGYRLIGYENRMLRTEDFNDDKKDAGEIGAGHTVTALYEVVPAGKAVGSVGVDPLKYQKAAKPQAEVGGSDELLTLKIRYKKPDGDTSTKLEFPITDAGQPFAEATGDFKFAAAVASFGMLLRDSEHRGNASFGAVLEIAEDGVGKDSHGYRAEFLQLVRQAKELRGGE